MNLPPQINIHLNKLIELCERFGATRLYAFGSVVSGKFDASKSDIDLFVEMEKLSPLARGENLIALWESLEDLFGRKVDLLTEKQLKNPYLRKSIEESKKMIYDRQSKKISV